MRSVSEHDAVWRNQRDHFFVKEARSTTRTVVAAGLLVQAATVAILIAAHYPTWRIAAMVGIYAGFVLGHRIIIGSTRDPDGVARAFIGMNVVAQLYVVGSCAVTGGIRSPLLFGTAMPAIVSLLFFGPQAVSRWMALANGLLVVAMVALPSAVVGPALPSGSRAPPGCISRHPDRQDEEIRVWAEAVTPNWRTYG